MVSVPTTKAKSSMEAQALLKAVAEELKLPLMQIARNSELAAMNINSTEEILGNIGDSAKSALELIDGYILGLQLAEQQQALKLEPVSAAAVMYDVAHKLDALAKRRELSLQLQIRSAEAPVMANRAGLSAALLSMGTAFVEAQPMEEKQQIITMAAYRAPGGLAAGLYSQACNVSSSQLKAAMGFAGKMRQPFGQFSAHSAAGVFVAQQILQAMAARLRVAKHNKQSGIAAILQPSRQLELV